MPSTRLTSLCALSLALALVLALASPGLAQTSSATGTVRTQSKGSTGVGYPTSTNLDANTQALDVAVKNEVIINGSTFNADSSLQVENIPALSTVATVTWTNATSVDSVLTPNSIFDHQALVLGFSPSGSLTGGTLNFEVYDGLTWFAIQGVRTDTLVAETSFALNGAPATAWMFNVAGASSFRVRLNPVITGTGSAFLRVRGTSFFTPVRQVVQEATLVTLVTGQQAVTASAVALPSNASKRVCVKAHDTNTIPIYVGPSTITTSTGFELGPGEGYCFRVANTNQLYVRATTTGASVSFAGEN